MQITIASLHFVLQYRRSIFSVVHLYLCSYQWLQSTAVWLWHAVVFWRSVTAHSKQKYPDRREQARSRPRPCSLLLDKRWRENVACICIVVAWNSKDGEWHTGMGRFYTSLLNWCDDQVNCLSPRFGVVSWASCYKFDPWRPCPNFVLRFALRHHQHHDHKLLPSL